MLETQGVEKMPVSIASLKEMKKMDMFMKKT